MKPLLILSPMASEMGVYLDALEEKMELTIAGRRCISGQYAGYPVAVLQTGMGLINTTIALTAALDRLSPCAVLSQGTAGAHTPDLKVGDIVCATRFVVGDSRKGEQVLPIEVMGQMVQGIDAHSYFIRLGQKYHLPSGTVMSGYAWNTDPTVLARCRAEYESLCEEMEDAAAAQVCLERGIPHGSLRVISNNHLRDDGGYDVTSAVHLQEFILELIKNGELHL